MLIDAFAANWMNTPNRLASLAGDVRLMLDGAFCAGLHRSIRARLRSDASVGFLFEALPSCTDESRDASPFVFSHEPANVGLARLLERCDGLPMMHCIQTDESPAGLAARLGSWCAVEADGQRFNLRFPDTRRLPGICAALTSAQRQEFFGPARSWRFVGRDGRWADLDLSRVDPVSSARVAVSPSFGCPQLDATQFASMLDDGEADAVLAVLQERGNHWSGQHSEVYFAVHAALIVARRAGLNHALTLGWCEACAQQTSQLDDGDGSAALSRWASQQSESALSSP